MANAVFSPKDFKVWIIERPGDLEALNECSAFFQKEGQSLYAYKLLTFYESAIAKNKSPILNSAGTSVKNLISEFHILPPTINSTKC